MAKGTKAEQAAAQADKATGLFTAAHCELSNALSLFAESEQEHREAAEAHVTLADHAKAAAERHQRIHTRLSELLA